MRYADIVLPLAQPLYTFAVAEGVTLCEGMAVVVPFGRSKIYTGIVWRLHDRRPDFKTVKTVSRVLYGTPLLDERQRRFWEWVADYYMCTLGEVMRVALPSLMKPSGHGEEEFAADEFRPRREWFVALAGEALTADGLAAALERMGRRAPRPPPTRSGCKRRSGRRWRSWLPLRPTGRKSPGADSPPIGRLSLSW